MIQLTFRSPTKKMLLLFLNTIEQPYMKPLRPDYIDFYNLSVTTSYENYTSKINGSHTALNLKTTKPGQSTTLFLAVGDQTWNYTQYKRTINSDNPPQNLIRNISFSYLLQDGNYTTSPASAYICKGLYFPNVSRGVADCVYNRIFAIPELTLNMEQITKQALDLNQQWPNQQQTTIINFQQKYNDGENGSLKAKNKPSVVFFTLSRTIRNKSQLTTYVPDQQIRHQWKKQGYLKNQVEWVPHIDATIIGQDAGYIIQANSQIRNTALQQKQAIVFYSLIGIIQIMFMFCNLKLAVRTDTYLKLTQLNILSLIILFSAQSLTIQLYCMSFVFLDRIFNIISFLIIINVIALFPLMFRFNMLLVNHLYPFYGLLKASFLTLLIIMTCMIPNFIIIVINFLQLLPLIASQILIIIFCSFVSTYSMFIAIKNQQPKYPISQVLMYTVDKIIILTYIFGVENCYQFQYDSNWCIAVPSIFLMQLFIYILQFSFGPRIFYSTKQKNINNFSNNSLNIQIIQQLQGSNIQHNDQDIILSYKDDNQSKNNICANYSHLHSELYDQKNKNFLLDLQQLQFMQQNEVPEVKSISIATNCYCYIRQSNIEQILCPICFDSIDFINANEKSFQRIFNDKNKLLSKQEIQYQSSQCLEKKQVWITPCGHCFHADCLEKWMVENLYCPACRYQINI